MKKSHRLKINQLNEALEHLLADLKNYQHQQLAARPGQGAWSALDVMQHLMLAEGRSVQYVKKKTSSPATLKKASFAATMRSVLLKLSLLLPVKYKAPAIVNEDHFREDVKLDELATEWRAIRTELSLVLKNLHPDWYNKEIFRHALAGRMTMDGMLDFFHDHFARHRKQIDRTLGR
mgnify:CR=1 FL=1